MSFFFFLKSYTVLATHKAAIPGLRELAYKQQLNQINKRDPSRSLYYIPPPPKGDFYRIAYPKPHALYTNSTPILTSSSSNIEAYHDVYLFRMANLQEVGGTVGKQPNAAKAAVFYTKTRLFFFVNITVAQL